MGLTKEERHNNFEEDRRAVDLVLALVCQELLDCSNGGVVVKAYSVGSPDHDNEFVLDYYHGLSDPWQVLARGRLNVPSDINVWEDCVEFRYDSYLGVYAALIRIQSEILLDRR